MDQKCPNCGDGNLVPLVQGIKKCSKCNKIVKVSAEYEEKKIEKQEPGEHLDAEYLQKRTALNEKYEIAEFGNIAFRDKDYLVAVIVAHAPEFPNSSYIRLSWFKGSTNQHYGMMKINNRAVANNLLKALKKFDEDFNDEFDLIKEITRSRKDVEYTNEFNMKKQLCLNCGTKMKKIKRYFECPRCGDLVILEDGNPIADIDPTKLTLDYESNLPVNYYYPYLGITINWLMAEWTAVVIVYAKENPRKKWLRFYTWTRNLQQVLSDSPTINISAAFRWEARKGIGSPNIYTKEELRKLIAALEKTMQEWKRQT